jgi:O-antigen/teichoic acid export membrane protein
VPTRAFITTLDQGVASASNFAVAVAVARISGVAGLGAFSLAYAAWLFVAAMHRSLVTDPMAITGDARHPSDARANVRAGFAAEVTLGLCTGGIFVLIGAALVILGQRSFGVSMLAVAPWVTFLLLQDYWRWIGFMQAKPGKALANDAVFDLVQAAGFAFLLVGHFHSTPLAIAAWGLGAVAGAVFGLWQFRVWPGLSGGWRWLRAKWAVSRWLAANSTASWGLTQLYAVLTAVILGPAGLGGLKAAQGLVSGPSYVLVQAGGSVGLPEASRAYDKHGWTGLNRVSRLVTGAGAASVGLVLVVVLFFGQRLLSLFYGHQFGRYASVAVVMAIAYVISTLSLGAVLKLKMTKQTRLLFVVSLVALVPYMLAVVALARTFGVIGAADAYAVGTALYALGLIGAARWVARHARQVPATLTVEAVSPMAEPAPARLTGDQPSGSEPYSLTIEEEPQETREPVALSVSARPFDRAVAVSALSSTASPRPERQRRLPAPAGSDEEYFGPMVDLSAMKEAVRRRRRLWVGAALAGLVIGAAFHLAVPARYSAVANLYMVEPASAQPASAMADDVSLLETRSVAAGALGALHLDANPQAFVSTYQGTAVSNEIMSVKLSAPSAAQAVAYDNAVVRSFLAVRSQELALQTKLVVAGLEAQVNALNADIKALTSQIDSLGAAGPGSQAASQVTSLVNQRTTDSSQVDQLQSQGQQDLLAEQSVVQGTQVLDPAVALRVSPAKVALTDALTGLVGGLFLGLGIVVVGAAVSDRPRRRAQVAAALGVPVELSVGPYRPPLWLRELRLRRTVKRPGSTLQMMARRLCRQLEASPGSALAVVAIGPTEPPALAVGALALSLAYEGQHVVLVDMADGRPLGSLFGVKATPGLAQKVVFDGQLLTLVVAPPDPGEMDEVYDVVDEADSVLVLASVSPARGAEHLARWATSAVVVVTAGKATGTLMTSCAEMLHRAGITARSAVLVGAGPEDESVGLVSDEAQLPPQQPQQPGHGPDGGNEEWLERASQRATPRAAVLR